MSFARSTQRLFGQTLVGLAAAVIDLGIDYPNYSRVKPYYNDQEFLLFMDEVEVMVADNYPLHPN